MKTHARSRAKKLLLTSAAAAAATLLFASPAAASVDDDFAAYTTDYCGAANFIDYGPGAPGGGNNDDYVVIHDYCPDGHGVRVWGWLDQLPIGSYYNGNGRNGAAVVWDPFRQFGNVDAGMEVHLEVCLVDGSGDTSGSHCGDAWHVSSDG